ncbi:hypothetical protein F8O01_16530 [Pseudoclavibacter chungangensis]|uniref:Uncharacterized protein n=1 Tax=Pseudoclavibacter chungangensis TaxID=587635 RepID=A0A7J5BMV5_9MICO|nr:hypothetical protein [Pseudoclavibacter chungangensis]KAB1652638.1 hypothetical protein F8O01_16530 [Pseudoclavibacter chungangensis]NYJ68359.1 hypothetical protein [Pseudoclavibacter chungangensis]
MLDVHVRTVDPAPVTTIVAGIASRDHGRRRRARAGTALSIVAFALAALCLLLTVLPGTVLYAGAAGLGSALTGLLGHVIVRHTGARVARIGAGVGAAALLVGTVVPIASIALDGVPFPASL